jgi:site-specific recombinase XerD
MIVNLLGHADIRTTARYSHLEDAHILAVADVVGAEIEKHIRKLSRKF